MDTNRLRELLDDRDAIDAEIAEIAASISGRLTVKTSTRKPQKCSKCGSEGHSARTCTQQTELPAL